MSKLRQLTEFLAQSLVDDPEKVVVKEREWEGTTVLELSVAPEDYGKIIGKQGRTARALRAVIAASSVKHKKRCVLEVVE